MRTLLWSVSALAIALIAAVPARADEATNKVVDEAIKAHGGAELLNKVKDKAIFLKGKMRINLMGGLDGQMEMYVASGMKKFKQDIFLSINGQDIKQTVAFDGKEVWIAIDGKVVMTLNKKEELQALEEAAFIEEAAGLALLKDKSIELSIIGEDKVGDTPVMGVRVSKKGRKDVSLYFDKKTHLLKKVVGRALDFQSGQEVEQERIMEDYKDVDGEKRPSRVVINQEGKKLVELEVTEMKYHDSLDDETFAKPKN